MKKNIQIDIVSDVVCPWCYIGEERLRKTTELLKDEYEFTITYHPFELNPHVPDEGLDAKAYFTEKFGSAQRMEQIFAQTTATAKAEGLEFDLSAQSIAPNTFNAHRLIALAKTESKQAAAAHAFFKAYFAEGKNLSKKETLVDIMRSVGIDESKVETVLNSNEFEDEVVQAEKLWQSRGISSVPSFIINNRYLVQGAQPPEAFKEVFEQLHPVVTDAPGCEGDNCGI